MKSLYPDYGLNGGGLHLMKDKGILNPHLDYVIHPKINLVRKFNLKFSLVQIGRKKMVENCAFMKIINIIKKFQGNKLCKYFQNLIGQSFLILH